MRLRGLRFVFLLFLLAFAAACSGGGDDGPGGTVQDFYGFLNEGDYATAMSLYSTEALEILENPDIAEDSTFAAWARQTTKDGKIQQVNVISAEESEGTATVEFDVRYKDGSSAKHNVQLKFEEGQWKLGLVS